MMVLTLLALALGSPGAHAAAYYFTDNGTRAMGRGGAFVAGVDDLTAQYYNPAGLTRMGNVEAYLDVSAISQYVYFDRADEDDLVFEAVENQSPARLIPAFGVASKFGLPDTTIALGMYTPFAPDLSYPSDGAQRYILNDMLILEVAGALSVGQKVNDWMSVGVGMAWWVLHVEQELAVTTLEGDDPSNDIDVGFTVDDRYTPSWNVGVLVDPVHWLTVGASIQPPISYEAEGSITTDFQGHAWSSFLEGAQDCTDLPGISESGPSFTDPDVRFLLTVPLIARAGLLVRPMDKLEVEAAWVYEGWHVLDQVIITDMDLLIDTKDNPLIQGDALVTNDIVLPTYYEDAWSARLGLEYDFNKTFTGRMGGYYETSGIPNKTQGVSFVDGSKYSGSLGGSVRRGGWSLDLAFAKTWLTPRTIDDSELRQLYLQVDLADPSNSAVVNGKVVGNGDFKSNLTFGSVGLTWRGEKKQKEEARDAAAAAVVSPGGAPVGG